jgi:predicted nucleotidyltransferase
MPAGRTRAGDGLRAARAGDDPAAQGPEWNSMEQWEWRMQKAEEIARDIDAERFGVVDLYVFGSTKDGTAAPCSDIDLLVHFRGSDEQMDDLLSWLERRGVRLSRANEKQAGCKTENLLDVHIVTDDDIKRKNSFASKINSIDDPARKLTLGRG